MPAITVSNSKSPDPRKEQRRLRHLKLSTKLHLFKFILGEWALNTSSHGITNIARLESKALKLMWLVCFLASLSYCVYTIVGIIQSFLQFQVLINQQVVQETPVPFPAVTFCNLNPFNRQNAQTYINRTLERNNLSYVQDTARIDLSPSLVSNLIKATIKGDRNLTRNQIEFLGYTLDYLLLTCYFNDVPCNKSDFVYLYDFDYTNCYTVSR